jgi:hypothetical protein
MELYIYTPIRLYGQHRGNFTFDSSNELISTEPTTWMTPSLSRGDRLRLKCDGTRAETTFRLSAKRTSLFKSSGASVQSTTGSRGVRISGSNAGYTMFRGSVKSTGYPLHSTVSPLLPLPCVTVCHHISTGLYNTHPFITYSHTTSLITKCDRKYLQRHTC